jgi:glycosyltransferase involved in cell wall biosynthesis
MMNDYPVLSIVTPSFNQAHFLEMAMRSVFIQDYPAVEYWVIDGGSDDGSVEIIERYADRLAGWESRKDHGQADAINKGFQKSTGEIVAWLNSDDVYLEETFQQAVTAFQEHPEVGLVYADGIMVDSKLRVLDYHRYPQVTLLDLLSFEVILQPTVFMRRKVLEEVGYLDPSYHLILDHELWVRIARRYAVLHIPAFWALERTHSQAKTIAMARDFVQEAEAMIRRAAEDDELAELLECEHNRVFAGLNVFAARRLIDAGQHQEAFRRLMAALRIHPATVMRYWYKVVQAGGSAIGLSWLFEAYRNSRRSIQYRGERIEDFHVNQPGPH